MAARTKMRKTAKMIPPPERREPRYCELIQFFLLVMRYCSNPVVSLVSIIAKKEEPDKDLCRFFAIIVECHAGKPVAALT